MHYDATWSRGGIHAHTNVSESRGANPTRWHISAKVSRSNMGSKSSTSASRVTCTLLLAFLCTKDLPWLVIASLPLILHIAVETGSATALANPVERPAAISYKHKMHVLTGSKRHQAASRGQNAWAGRAEPSAH